MELLDLTLFDRVAREGSISRAAAAVGMAQPAVSNRIRSLEAELGQALFHRGRRGVELTPAGERFLDYVRRCLDLLQEGRGSLAVPDRQQARIGLSVWAEPFILPMVDRYVRDENGWVSVTVGRAHDLAVSVIDGKVDVAFMVPVPLQAGIRTWPVTRGRVVCAAIAGHPLRKCGPIRLADLLAHPLALSHWGDGFEDLMAHLQAIGGGPVSRAALVPPNLARALAVERGYVTFLPDVLIAEDVAAGMLAPLPVVDFPPVPWRIDAVFRDRKNIAPGVMAFLRSVPGVC